MNSIELTLDTDYAPELPLPDFGEPKDEIKFILVKYITESNDLNVSILEDTPEIRDDIKAMENNSCVVEIIGSGTAKHTSIAELIYGINHPTRLLFRVGVNDLVKTFKEGDKLLKDSLK